MFSDKGSTRQIQFPISHIDADNQIMTLWPKCQMLLFLCFFFFPPRQLCQKWGFPGRASGKQSACQCRRHKVQGTILGSGRIPGGGNDNPHQYPCLKKSHGQRSLVGYSQKGPKESDMTQNTPHTHTHTHKHQK